MIKSSINSTLGLATGFLLTIILHELAHYIMSVILGYEATLYHNRVFSETNGIKNHEIMIAGIAPLFSLVQGVLAYQASKKMESSSISLFVLWFGITGIITFFGYLMIAPLIPIGDTGKVFSLLNIPWVIQAITSIIAIAMVTIILMKSAKQFERYAIEDFGSVEVNRKKWSVSLILMPLLLSIVLVTLFQFPIPHILSILATICIPFSIMAVFGAFIGSKDKLRKDPQGNSINQDISIPLICLFIFVGILNRILVNGISLANN